MSRVTCSQATTETKEQEGKRLREHEHRKRNLKAKKTQNAKEKKRQEAEKLDPMDEEEETESDSESSVWDSEEDKELKRLLAKKNKKFHKHKQPTPLAGKEGDPTTGKSLVVVSPPKEVVSPKPSESEADLAGIPLPCLFVFPPSLSPPGVSKRVSL